jgi:hypothetical protein
MIRPSVCTVRVKVPAAVSGDLVEYVRSSSTAGDARIAVRRVPSTDNELLLEVVYHGPPTRCQRALEVEEEILHAVYAWRRDYAEPPIVMAYQATHRSVQVAPRLSNRR